MSRDPLPALLRRAVDAGRMPAAVWWVERRGRVLSRGAVGSRVLQPVAEPAGEATPFDLASLTKVLATSLLLALFESEGRLRLDRPVSEIVPELHDSPYGNESLAALAAHCAGFPPWRPLYLAGPTREAFLASIAATPRAVSPGCELYSDLGYVVLGIVVERAGGAPLADLFAERIAGPLRLPRAGYGGADRGFPDAAATEIGNAYERDLAGPEGASHAWRREPIRGVVHDGNAHALGGAAGHAGLFGTAEEVALISRELLLPRRLPLEPGPLDRLRGPWLPRGSRTLGLVLARGSRATRGILPDLAPGHTGFTGTSLWLEPATRSIHVLLTNRVHPTVPRGDFQYLRRAFHRVSRGLVDRSIAGPSGGR